MADARKLIVGGNWKMNTNCATGMDLAYRIVGSPAANSNEVDVVVYPPFPYLLAIRDRLRDSPVVLGAQDVYGEPDGAFTGEVSVAMLRDCGCNWVLCGHSERRHVIGEPDDLINRKLRSALVGGLNVTLCVGETQAQREAGQTDRINIAQVRAGLDGVSATQMNDVVIAYEPVWAIGTGLTATPEDAQSAHQMIRQTIGELFGDSVAASVRIQYGGSVKPGNAAELFAQPDIDGGLIGGASLKADDFLAIIDAARGAA